MAIRGKNQTQGLLATVFAALLLYPAPPVASPDPSAVQERSAQAQGIELPADPIATAGSDSTHQFQAIVEPFDLVLEALQIPTEDRQQPNIYRTLPSSYKNRN